MSNGGSHIKLFALRLMRLGNRIWGGAHVVKNAGLEKAGDAYNAQRFYGPRKLFCYAPFRSIFVAYDGRVSPCYACKAQASLKQQTLEEIWNGDVFNNLRQQFKAGVVPDECSFCRGHLKNENFGSILASKYDHHTAGNGGFPAIAELELGNQCHLECVMCCGELSSAIRSNREHKAPVERMDDNLLAQQFEFCLPHLRAAEFTGGDPFLIPVYKQLWERIEKVNPGLDILITTNANTMNATAEALLAGKLRLSFNVSIDSLTPEVYEKIRKNAHFDTAIKNIGIFAQYTQRHQTSIGFLVCPLQLNRNELPDFIEFANNYQATLSYHVVFKPAGLSLWTLSSDELSTLEKHLQPYQFRGNDFRTRINARSYDALVTLVRSWAQRAEIRENALETKSAALERTIENAKQIFWDKLASVVSDDETLKHHMRRVTHLVTLMEVEAMKELVFVKLAEIPPHEIEQALQTLKDAELQDKLARYHNSAYYEYFAGEGLSDNDKYELSMKGQLW